MDPQLADRIYECAFIPERWPSVLDQLATIAEGVGGHLIASSPDTLRWTASAVLSEKMKVIAPSGLLQSGQRPVRLSKAQHPGFLTDHDLFTDKEIASDPTYRNFLLPAGLGWGAGTAILLPTNTTLYFTVERLHTRGPVEPAVVQQLDALRPHLARSALMSSRLHLERARVASETLALVGLPSLVFDGSGTVLAASRTIESMTDYVVWRGRDRVSLKDRNANRQFQEAVETLDSERGKQVLSFAVRGPEDGASVVAHVIPIRGNARDIFVGCTGVLILTPVAAPHAPSVELIQSLFDLTPAEARVARNLSTGDTLDEIAATGGVSRNTVRTHVRGLLEKTGCHRQAEVVALLCGVAVPHN